MFRKYYSEFLEANPNLIHMAAHSHHYWPDVAREANEESYNDAVNLIDNKWSKIIGEVVPSSQALISKMLNFSRPEDIAFASNTHEILMRLLSCFPDQLNVLTTDSEFHSASRQFARLEELERVSITRVSADSPDFLQEFEKEIKSGKHNFIFLSHVFFTTGKLVCANDIKKLVKARPASSVFCLDGYHSFCALPLDLSEIEDDIFYLAGGYKYAQAGEGMCFMTLPKNCELRPVDTGWFASFDSLKNSNLEVAYANNGWRFAGSTRDFTAHYRFNKIWETFFSDGHSIASMTEYIKNLQTHFLDNNPLLDRFYASDIKKVGRFLTLKTGSSALSERLYEALKGQGILTDYRGENLRFGFGLYLNQEDVKKVRAFLGSQIFNTLFKNSP